MDYKEQIKSPEWQRKRLEIMQRDNFQCQNCFDKKNQLVVHHKEYIKGRMIWQYEDELITLCKNCHDLIHSELESNGIIMVYCAIFDITVTDYLLLHTLFHRLKKQQGDVWIKTVYQLILAQVIKESEI